MNSMELSAIPEPQALTKNNIDETMRRDLLPYKSASLPAKNAPIAHPSNMLATLKPVPTEFELNAFWSPSTVPLITPLSKPNKNPPIVATILIKMIKIQKKNL